MHIQIYNLRSFNCLISIDIMYIVYTLHFVADNDFNVVVGAGIAVVDDFVDC